MQIEIFLLGGFRAFADGRAVAPAALSHRSLELVKLLALKSGHRASRESVLEALWPHLDDEAGARALHKAGSLARKAFGDKGAVVLRQGAVLLAPDDQVVVDVDVFERDAGKALADEDDDACAAVAARFSGALLPEDTALGWTQEPRDRIAGLHLRLLREASAWEDVVAIDPTDEDAQRSLMRWYLDTGNRAAALRQFRLLKEALARDLQAQPEPETMRLHDEIARTVMAVVPQRASLVGRDVELVRGRALLRSAMSGDGQTLLVVGDAGVGKTSLCDALLDEVRASGVDVVQGAAHVDLGQAPWGPVVEALARLCEARPGLVERLGESTREVLARVGVLFGPLPAEPLALPRHTVLSAFERALTTAATQAPLVLFLDDLHDADASTLDVVVGLARAVRGRPVALVCTMRHGAAAHVERARQRIMAQGRAAQIDLRGLSHEESARLVEARLGRSPDAAFVDAVWAHAHGNPFLTDLLATTPALDDDLAPTVDALRIVEARFARIDDPLRAFVEAAAVAGDEVSTEVLSILCGQDPDPPADAAARLDDAVAAGVMVPARGGFRFRHALLRESLLATLPRPRRLALHARVARVLASTGGRAAEIALHLAGAGDDEAAAPWFVQSAREHAALGAWDSALVCVERAIAAGARDAAVLGLCGDLRYAVAHPGAIAAYDEALSVADDDDRPDLLVRRAYALMSAGRVPEAAQSIEGVGVPDDADAAAGLLFLRSALAWFMGRPEEADLLTSEARALGPRVRNRVLVAENVMMGASSAGSRGTFEEKMRHDFLAATTDPAMVVAIHEGYVCAAEGFLYGGRPYGEVERVMRDVLQTAEKGGVRRASAFARGVLGGAQLLQGKLDEALDTLQRAETASREIGAFCSAAMAMQRQADVHMLQGRPEVARPLLQAAWDVARLSPLATRHVLQRIAGSQVRAARSALEAADLVKEAGVAIRGPHEGCFACMIALSVPSTSALARIGELDSAQAHLAMAKQSMQVFWRGSGGWHAAVAEAQGEALVAEGKGDEARQSLQEAASLFRHVGQPLDLQRVSARLEQL